MASLSDSDRAALRQSWERQNAAVRQYLWVLFGRKNAPALREPLHAAFLKLAALKKQPAAADELSVLFRFAREAAGRVPGQTDAAELLALKFGYDLSYRQIAAIVKMPVKEISLQFHEALKKQRQSRETRTAAVARP